MFQTFLGEDTSDTSNILIISYYLHDGQNIKYRICENSYIQYNNNKLCSVRN